jgi:23S rRNA (adenine2503-C2)-methyltransferase
VLEMTDLPLVLRQDLTENFHTRTIRAVVHLHSERDRTEKALFELTDGHKVETVLIRSRSGRKTVCISSQVGCPAACTFCATGLGGFARNLTSAEMVDQVMFFAHRLKSEGSHVTNVVYMGMGEPLLNTTEVRSSIERLTDSDGFGLGQRHITVSTVGIIPQIRSFASWAGQVNLAISLHAPNDALRSELVPYNRKFPLSELMSSVHDYCEKTRRRVSFEYVLLHNVNDSAGLATELAQLVKPLGGLAHVNLIPWNPFREGHFVRSQSPDAESFAEVLRSYGVNATIRYSKGLDISAACGQLREQAGNGETTCEVGPSPRKTRIKL